MAKESMAESVAKSQRQRREDTCRSTSIFKW